MRSMACALHVVVLGFRRRLHGPESSPKREGARIAGGCGQPWAGHYPSQARLTSGNGNVPGAGYWLGLASILGKKILLRFSGVGIGT